MFFQVLSHKSERVEYFYILTVYCEKAFFLLVNKNHEEKNKTGVSNVDNRPSTD